MTLKSFGSAVPVQLHMLGLVGYVSETNDMIPTRSRNVRKIAMLDALHSLKNRTGVDFGFDPEAWRHFLIQSGNEFGYTHPYAFECVNRAVRTALADPEVVSTLHVLSTSANVQWIHEQRMRSLEQEPGKLSTEGLALVIVETLIEAGIVERRQIMSAVPVVRQEITNRKLLGEY